MKAIIKKARQTPNKLLKQIDFDHVYDGMKDAANNGYRGVMTYIEDKNMLSISDDTIYFMKEIKRRLKIYTKEHLYVGVDFYPTRIKIWW